MLRRRAQAFHLLLGALVLAVASSFVGFGGYFFIDEAALYGQLAVMERGDGGWTIPVPFPDRDVDAEHVPMARSDVVGDRYAPFAKHPVHVVLARAMDAIGGDVGVRALSSVGLLAAAAAAAAIAGLDRARGAVAFWVTLVASPLLFDANLVVAHTLGAAVAGVLFAVVLRVRRPLVVIPAAAVLSALGGLLRNEFVLLSGAAFLVLALRAFRRRSVRDAAISASVLAGGIVAYVSEPFLVRWVLGGRRPGLDQAPTAGASLADVAASARRSLVDAGGAAASRPALVGLVVCGALVAMAAAAAARRQLDRTLVALVAGGALAGSLLFAADPHLVTGIVWAFPALLVLVAAAARSVRIPEPLGVPLATAGIFAILVAGTQYSQGGGLEWGWRYVAIAVPLVTPALGGVLFDLWSRRPESPRAALVVVCAACVAVQAGGLRVQRTLVSDTEQFLERVDEVVGEADADWVVSLDASFGRFAYPLSVGGNVATASGGAGSEVLRWLAADEVDDVLVVWRFGDEMPLEDPGGYAVTDRTWYVASEYRATLLRRS